MAEPHDAAEMRARLYKAIKGARAVMLGVIEGPPSHFNPMKGYVVEDEKPVWFLCRGDVRLVGNLGGETRAAMMNVVSEDHHVHACVMGVLEAERDQARIDLFWNSVAEAWLPEGKTSPDVVLLRFDPQDAEVWLSDNAFKLAWEVAKANYNHERTTSGEKANLSFV